MSSSGSTENSKGYEKALRNRGYTLNELLYEGFYAKVYKAQYSDPDTKKCYTLACKVVNSDSAEEQYFEKFFPRELDISTRVNHVSLIRTHSILQRKTKFFIFMEFAHNGNLLDFLMKNGPVKENTARRWFIQILKGLEYLHSKGIAHRDLKCENLLLTESFNMKIGDFGFAVPYKPGVLSDTYCGSSGYAAPEVLFSLPYDAKMADMWSLGVVLFVMLCKSFPFDNEQLSDSSGLNVSDQHWDWEAHAEELQPALSEGSRAILRQLLQVKPEDRPNAAELSAHSWLVNEEESKPAGIHGMGQGVEAESTSR